MAQPSETPSIFAPEVGDALPTHITTQASPPQASPPSEYQIPSTPVAPPSGPEQTSSANPTEGIHDTQRHQLFRLSLGQHLKASYNFNRFESLSILNILYYQHELVMLDSKITSLNGRIQDDDIVNLRKLLREYYEAIISFKEISQHKRPEMQSRLETAQIMAQQLNEMNYLSGWDSKGMLDLTPEAMGVAPDGVRVFMQKLFSFAALRNVMRFQMNTHLHSHEFDHQFHRPTRHIGRVVDNSARLLTAIGGGAYIIIPMVILFHVKSRWLELVVVVISVLVFAVMVALASKANNQELWSATAAYAAVLVVFVNQNAGQP